MVAPRRIAVRWPVGSLSTAPAALPHLKNWLEVVRGVSHTVLVSVEILVKTPFRLGVCFSLAEALRESSLKILADATRASVRLESNSRSAVKLSLKARSMMRN